MGNLYKDFSVASNSLAELGRQLAPSLSAMDSIRKSSILETFAEMQKANTAIIQNSGIAEMGRLIVERNKVWSEAARLPTSLQALLPPRNELAEIAKWVEFDSRPMLSERIGALAYSAIKMPPLPARTSPTAQLEAEVEELRTEVHQLRVELAEARIADQHQRQEVRQRLVQTQHGVGRLVDWFGLNDPPVPPDDAAERD